jgi:hypothetical protein
MATAVTNIQHGDEEGNVIYVEAGEEVPAEIPVDELPPGTVTDEPTDDDQQKLRDLEAEVEELRSKLATVGQTAVSRGGGSPLDMGIVSDPEQLEAANEDVTGGEPASEEPPVEESSGPGQSGDHGPPQ